jgi:hypothetical protein
MFKVSKEYDWFWFPEILETNYQPRLHYAQILVRHGYNWYPYQIYPCSAFVNIGSPNTDKDFTSTTIKELLTSQMPLIYPIIQSDAYLAG